MSEAELKSRTDGAKPSGGERSFFPERKDLEPDEVLELLRAGKTIENARIKRLKFRGSFDQPIRFRNCLLNRCEFAGATFDDDVKFLNCTIERASFTKPTVFERGWDISHSTLEKTLITNVTVKGKFSAQHTEFCGKFLLSDSVFEGGTSFWEAKFRVWTDIKKCVFHQTADFRSCNADQGFVINRCVFHGDFLFRGASVEKKFEADRTRFDGLVDLSKAKLRDFAYLESIEQGEKQTFAFLNAVADRIRIRPKQLEGRLASENAGRYDEAMQEYGLLKCCYQSLHWFDAEDWAFYRFKVCQRRSKPRTWRRPWTVWRGAADWLFLDVGCGYGTSPLRAVQMALVIVLAFAALYAVSIDLLYAEKLPFDGPKESLANRLMIGLTTSVSVFTSGMGEIREMARGWMNIPVMIESIMGALLFGLFIVAFSRKVIR